MGKFNFFKFVRTPVGFDNKVTFYFDEWTDFSFMQNPLFLPFRLQIHQGGWNLNVMVSQSWRKKCVLVFEGKIKTSNEINLSSVECWKITQIRIQIFLNFPS